MLGSPRKPRKLTITVPDGNNSDLEDDDSNPICFDSITQLPTPIISNNNFNKLRRFDERIVSEYKPVAIREKEKHAGDDDVDDNVSNVKNSISNRIISEFTPSISLLNFKRYVSNPVSIPDCKTPPLTSSASECKYIGQKFVIHNEIFTGHSLIGKGNFSSVIHAVSTIEPNTSVAIKIISIPISSKSEINNFKSFIKRELNILYQLNHPTLIRLLDCQTNLAIHNHEVFNSNYFSKSDSQSDLSNSDYDNDYQNLKQNQDQLIVLNYCHGENLYKFSLNYYSLFEFQLSYWLIIKRVVCEMMIAIKVLHSMNIIHRDIKLENVLLNYTFDELVDIYKGKGTKFSSLDPAVSSPYPSSFINLTDFGLSKKLGDESELLSTRCGSQDYISPELLMGIKYNGKLTDSWSVGVLIYSLLENRLPFDIPPLSALSQTQISPSVIKRKRANNNPAHRIATIDWNWYKINDILSNSNYSQEIKTIVNQLKSVVDLLLVRKDKRKTVTEIFDSEKFDWIRKTIPSSFYENLEV